jgi:hypothetical protein
VLEPTLSVAIDDAATFTYQVRNDGDEAVRLAFSTSQRVEVEVYAGDDLVWRFGDGRMFAQALGEEEIAPGSSFEEAVTWDDPEPGRYVAVASLAAAEVDAEVRAAFEV